MHFRGFCSKGIAAVHAKKKLLTNIINSTFSKRSFWCVTLQGRTTAFTSRCSI